MAWAPDYVTASTLKTVLGVTVTSDDTYLGFVVTAASRAVDQYCNRQFGLVDPATERIYTWLCDRYRGRPLLFIDDVQTTTSLAVAVDRDGDGVAEDTLTIGDDFELWPTNAADDAKPWTGIVLNTGVTFPTGLDAVSVTAKWGWTTVPGAVSQATIIQASRFYARKDSPYGIAGSPDTGSEMRLLAKVDPDVAVALNPVRRVWGVV